ncbi:MAG: hypothetical protein J1F28_02775 [Oscillospiraceae bacterium]|nr:hypothetical protein [Oscillospiraceae bacterium]
MTNKDEGHKTGNNWKLFLLTAVLIFIVLIVVIILIITNPYKTYRNRTTGEIGENGFVGTGTEIDPYLISNVDDLCNFRDLVNSGTKFSGNYFLQTESIDLSGIDNWEPIGIAGSDNYFYGSYNGDGHTINNLTITGTDGYAYNGLFGELYGEVRNLGIESGYIEGMCAGSIASHGSSTSAIINCYNKATIHGVAWAGGMVVAFQGRVSYCWNLGEVICDTNPAAGISPNNALIKNCFSYQLPVVSDIFSGSVTASEQFLSLDEIDITKLWELQYNEELGIASDLDPTERVRFIVTTEDTISFDRNYIPSYVVKKNIEGFFADYGAILLLAIAALVLIIIANHKPAALGTVLTLALICGSYSILNDTLRLKEFTAVTDFYVQPENSIDVLLIGSSMVGVNQSCEVLWKDYGISGYAFSSGSQPFWISYYFLNEALKTCDPKVVVIDVSVVTNLSDTVLKWPYLSVGGLKFSLNKLEAIQASAQQESWMDLLLGFPIYHTRYSELDDTDFESYPWNQQGINYKGSTNVYGTGNVKDLIPAADIETVQAISEKHEEFLVKIIEECNTKDIPLVLVTSFKPNRKLYQPHFNYIAELVSEYDVPFIDFNHLDEELGIELNDIWTDNNHLNIKGARKQSEYLGQYLKENYDLFDHRGDPYYSSWDVFSVNQQNMYIPIITDRSDYLKELVRDDRTVVIIKQSVDTSNPAYEAFLQDAVVCGFDMSFLNSMANGCWIVEHPGISYANIGLVSGQRASFQLDDEEIIVDLSGQTITYAGESLTTIKNGITFIVYDPNTEQIIDKCVIYETPSGSVVSHV